MSYCKLLTPAGSKLLYFCTGYICFHEKLELCACLSDQQSEVSLFTIDDIVASNLVASQQKYKQMNKTDAALFVPVSADNALLTETLLLTIYSLKLIQQALIHSTANNVQEPNDITTSSSYIYTYPLKRTSVILNKATKNQPMVSSAHKKKVHQQLIRRKTACPGSRLQVNHDGH